MRVVKTTGDPPAPRMGHGSTVIGDKLFIFGGTAIKSTVSKS